MNEPVSAPCTIYPATSAARNRWILAKRGTKNSLDPWRPYHFLWEEEPDATGRLVPTATVFLSNRECPFRCLMCDLWQNTLDTTVPPGAVPAQIEYALSRLPPVRQVKLYNAGSFFDPGAIPPGDDPAIAQIVSQYERVIVECHPSFVGERCLRFRDSLTGRLEVAIGLETVHPEVLERLNKRFTVGDFQRAASFVTGNDMDLRVFLLLRPPFLSDVEGLTWAKRSLEVSFDAGASVCAVIPTRAGNGALEALAAAGEWAPPKLSSLEAAQAYGLSLARGRVFSDLWDIERFFADAGDPARAARLAVMNQTQRIPSPQL